MSTMPNLITPTALPQAKSAPVALKGLMLPLMAGHGTMLFLMTLFGHDLPRLQSLLSVSFAALCGLVLIFVLYARRAFGNKAILILLAAFLAKEVLGVVHSLSFFDANYFANDSNFEYLPDFVWMEDKMKFASGYWRQNGLSPLPLPFYDQNKNPFLLAYNGLLYYLSGDNYVNISPWNALHSLYVALIVGALALEAGASRVQARFALAIAAFQPFGFISNIMWRDSIGQFWMLLGLYLLFATREKKYLWVVTLPIAAFLAWSQRQPYIFVVLAVAVYLSVASIFQEKLKLRTKIAIACLLVSSAILLPKFFQLGFARYESGGQLSLSPLLLPFRAVRAIAGPFPWHQIFMDVAGAAFMPADFAQAVYNLTLIVLAAPVALKMWREKRRIDPCLLAAACLFAMGVQATGVHIGYVSIGIVLLLPVVCQLPSARWFRTLAGCFYGFLFANILYGMSGLTGGGIIMSVTGY